MISSKQRCFHLDCSVCPAENGGAAACCRMNLLLRLFGCLALLLSEGDLQGFPCLPFFETKMLLALSCLNADSCRTWLPDAVFADRFQLFRVLTLDVEICALMISVQSVAVTQFSISEVLLKFLVLPVHGADLALPQLLWFVILILFDAIMQDLLWLGP